MSNNNPYSTANGSGDSDLRWIKSSFSFANGDCVEVASLPDGNIGVRDSKDTSGPVLQFTHSEWQAFIGGARNGEFDHLVAS
jgi:hypothetical protein